jgi:hypothetical protein
MKLTRHAAVRGQQRGFQANDINLILGFGTPVRRPGNVTEYRMTRKDAKRLVQASHRITNKAVLIDAAEETIVTVMNLTKRGRGCREPKIIDGRGL